MSIPLEFNLGSLCATWLQSEPSWCVFLEQNDSFVTCIIYEPILAQRRRASLLALLLMWFFFLCVCPFRLHASGDGQIVS